MGDNGFSSTFGLETAAGFLIGEAFAGSRMLLRAFFDDFNCDEGADDVECWNLDMEELMLWLADGTDSGFATDDAVVEADADAASADFSAMATFSFILARRMLLLVDLTLFGLEAEE